MSLGLVFFVLAAVVFGINALDVGSVESAWGFFCLALGHVFGGVGLPFGRREG